ncbi:MAG: ATP-dependent helicase HrpB [Pikeienuella sp.]
MNPSDLPVAAALPALRSALAGQGVAVLTAPPGAGKTTLVPLALADEPWATGRILMLEPRRLAARAAAARMASLRGDKVGESVGFRIRGESKTSSQNQIEVVTEGILTRMLQTDPELQGISAVIFDEFHERSLHADLGLALTLECRAALRPDLKIVVMSATLDAAPVAALMDNAPIVQSEGRAFPVETHWLEKPFTTGRGMWWEDGFARLIEKAAAETQGDILAFLPGVAEIERVRRKLSVNAEIAPLHGALPYADQKRALAPAKGRKIVLATNIAETSLTVEGVKVVVDGGRARRARYDAGAGMTRMSTERISRAEADQRQGRAGRLAPGVCYRFWTRGEEGALSPFAPAEIEIADLAPLALELAAWGASEAELAFLSAPPAGALIAARDVLASLGGLDTRGGVTEHGKALAAAPTHPRLAHMILTAPKAQRYTACMVAALLEERDPLRGQGADLSLRMRALARPEGASADAARRIVATGKRLAKRLGIADGKIGTVPGPLIALAYPDRIAARRKGGEARYVLSGGQGAKLSADDALAGEAYVAVAEMDNAGHARGGPDATVRLAAPISRAEIESLFKDQISWIETCEWSKREGRVVAQRRLKLGAIALETKRWRDAPAEIVATAMLDGIRELGLPALPWTGTAKRLAARVIWAVERGADLPDFNDAGLMGAIDDWLAPYLDGAQSREDLGRVDLNAALQARLGWDGAAMLDRIAPVHFAAPTGTKAPIDYSGAHPSISIRLQELFGLNTHPCVGPNKTPLLLNLLSPAQRPVQMTADLPGFWRTSYADVRKDMRGRYPRHPWPDDPAGAVPTRRVKPRGT